MITIVGAALGPLPFGWAAAHGGYFPVLAGGAVLCGLTAVVNLAVRARTEALCVRVAPFPRVAARFRMRASTVLELPT